MFWVSKWHAGRITAKPLLWNLYTKPRYYLREDAEACIRYVNGTRLDDRIVRTDWDAGFREGRQYGRGKTGGQVGDVPLIWYLKRLIHFIIPQVKIVSCDWLTEVHHSMLLCSQVTRQCYTPAVHIFGLLIKSSLPMLVMPSWESWSYQSFVTLTPSKTGDGLSPHLWPAVIWYHMLCCVHSYFTIVGFVQYNKTNMTSWWG